MNKAEREKLKDRVLDLVLTGYTYDQIAEILKIGRRTVVNYVNSRRQQSLEEIRASADEQIAEMELAKKKRTQKLWTIVLDESESGSDRNRALQLLQNEESLMIKRRQLIGLLPAEAPLVAIQNNVVEVSIADSIKREFPELVERFKSNKAKVITTETE